MASDFVTVFEALKPVLQDHADRLVLKKDTPSEFWMVTKTKSPFPQHKGHPLDFGMVRIGKAYVSLHLLPVYMSPDLGKAISPELKKRMQGKACFNFKAVPDEKQLADLRKLTAACIKQWEKLKWM